MWSKTEKETVHVRDFNLFTVTEVRLVSNILRKMRDRN